MRAWRDHERELRGCLRRRIGNDADAEHQLQELFLKALPQGERFCELGNARGWLFEGSAERGRGPAAGGIAAGLQAAAS